MTHNTINCKVFKRAGIRRLHKRRWHPYIMHLFCVVLLILLSTCILAQDTTKFPTSAPPQQLRGSVIGELGDPISGASIQIKGADNGVVTDQTGWFVIKNITGEVTLIISGANIDSLELRTTVTTKPLFIRTRTKYITNEEVVVASTGYQKLKPNEITGSVAVIDKKTINFQVGSRIIDRLNGVAPGVLFPKGKADAPEFMVRGLSTINGPKAPLIILDDFPYEGDINNINPNDVESITILKDAAAASIWGTRAGNGVIVITSKKGKLNSGMRISLNANTTFFEKPDLFYNPRISSEDYVELEKLLYEKGYYNDQMSSPLYPALSPAVELLIKRDAGVLSPGQANEELERLKQTDSRKAYQQDFYRLALHQQYALSASGGTDRISWIFSGGYDRNLSDRSERFERASVRLQNDFRISKKLSASVNAVYTSSKSRSGAPDLASLLVGTYTIPYLRFSDDQGSALPIARSSGMGFIDTLGGGQLLDGHFYPLTDWKHDHTTTHIHDLATTAGLKYAITKGINLDVKYFYERQSTRSSDLADINSSQARSLINLFTQLNRATGAKKYVVPPGGILNRTNGTLEAGSFRSQLNVDRRFQQHRVSGLLGFEMRQVSSQSEGYALYGYNDDNLTFTPVDVVNPYPTTGGGTAYIPSGAQLSDITNRYVSLFTNIVYTYRNRYLLSVSGRRDASNLFGINTNDKWNPLWSAGAGWELSKEPFYQLKKLPLLKLRVTYGYSGNFDPSMAAVTTLSVNSGASHTNYNYAIPSNYANPELRWEKVRTINLGLDFGTIGSRLTGSLEYYQKTATDLFGPELLDYTSGLRQSTIVKNVASMKAGGIDLTLQSLNIDRAVKWNTFFQFSYYSDRVTHYYRPPAAARAYVRDGTSVNSITGLPVYALVSYKWAGLDPKTGNPQGWLYGQLSTDYTGITGYRAVNGYQDLESMIRFDGPGLPKYYGSFMNTISFKGIALTINLTYRLGYYFRYSGLNYTNLLEQGAYAGSGDYKNRWQQPGDEQRTDVPSFLYPLVGNRDDFYTNSSATVLSADHIRLQFINLSYDLPLKKYSKNRFTNVQMHLNANNMRPIWKANNKGIDPDYGMNTPAPGSWTIGLRANF